MRFGTYVQCDLELAPEVPLHDGRPPRAHYGARPQRLVVVAQLLKHDTHNLCWQLHGGEDGSKRQRARNDGAIKKRRISMLSICSEPDLANQKHDPD